MNAFLISVENDIPDILFSMCPHVLPKAALMRSSRLWMSSGMGPQHPPVLSLADSGLQPTKASRAGGIPLYELPYMSR
jgi:hypothetical protein